MTEWQRNKNGNSEREKRNPFYIEEKFKDYIYYIDPMLDKFPKSERFGLYKTIKELNYSLLSDIIISAKLPARERNKVLKSVDRRLQALKFFVRYSYDSPKKCIGAKTYEVASGKLCEIGSMVGGIVNTETTPHSGAVS